MEKLIQIMNAIKLQMATQEQLIEICKTIIAEKIVDLNAEKQLQSQIKFIFRDYLEQFGKLCQQEYLYAFIINSEIYYNMLENLYGKGHCLKHYLKDNNGNNSMLVEDIEII